MVIKLGIYIFQNKNSVFGATFIVFGFSFFKLWIKKVRNNEKIRNNF